MRLTDILLLPGKLYTNLTGKRSSMYPGILFIGLADLALPNLRTSFNSFFADKPAGTLTINIILSVLLVIILGAVDAMFFSVPLYDLFKVFKKEKEPVSPNELRIKLVKIYVMAHIIIIPVGIAFYFAFRNVNSSSSDALKQLIEILSLLIEVWFSAIIARGINMVYSFQPLFKRLVFPVVFIWNTIFGYVLGYAISNWVLLLYR